MVLVTIFGASVLIKKEFTFDTLTQANTFLTDEKFIYDCTEDNAHYWHLDGNTFALIEPSS